MTLHWSTLQVTEFLVSVSRPGELRQALRTGLERAIESLDAEAGAVLVGGTIVASIGFGSGGAPAVFLAAALADASSVALAGTGELFLAGADLDEAGASGDRLVVGRLGEPCSAEETQLLQAYALVLGLVRHNLSTLHAVQSQNRLVNTLLAIQRSISARQPLQELLNAVTEGAASLLCGAPVALLLADPATPGALIPASTHGIASIDTAMSSAVHQAMDGSQVSQGTADDAPAAIASPVVVDGSTAGCLVARLPGSADEGREGSELLAAFAQQVSLALTDARTMDAVREAHRDPVTGLSNRKLLLQQLDRERRAALDTGRPLSVLFIDLDRFKAVNDTLGHQAGDELLALVAGRILGCIRSDDLTARLGGDEFAVVLPDADPAAGRLAAARIIAAMSREFVVGGRTVSVGASVGLAALTSAHADAGALLSDADVAMYSAKRSGRAQLAVYEPQMSDAVDNELSLRTDLAQAIALDELSLVYQPFIDLDGGALRGAEALMRWSHPTRGAVPPSTFIPIAEQTDMICSLGRWALGTAAAQVVEWRTSHPDLGMAVNIAARHIIDPALPRTIRDLLAATGLTADALTLEITESGVLGDHDVAARCLAALKDIGVQIAIDDFGTGYSSLSYLRRLPVDVVKIDRSFVTPLHPQAHEDIAIVESLLVLCHRLRLRTVAEGIENQTQLDVLRELGCDLGQGYLLARPQTPAQWAARLIGPGAPARYRAPAA